MSSLINIRPTHCEVVFNDTMTDSPDMAAVHADSKSTYKAEETTFDGFEGEVGTSSLPVWFSVFAQKSTTKPSALLFCSLSFCYFT